MKTLFALSSIALLTVGCATTGGGLPGRDGPLGGKVPEVNVQPVDGAQPTFPDRIGVAALPGADRLSHRIDAEHDGAIATQVRLCVAPSGEVAQVGMLSSSGMPEFDRAVVDGVGRWQYASYAAPDGTRVCENLTVGYRAP
ncbi:MAG: TonB C-terminal domain-containing protein [Kofleriaceae bacterium]|nr:TonB C-terminal domain-containing protein [Myxococcales bacterium]MCB9572975.1 TonB C-terminal domain-containing protein [Kofleriaceae bacterium]